MSQEDEFLQRIHSKSVTAFRELFREFYNTLVLFSMNYVERQEVAEDIVQDLFVSIWERDTRYASYNSFKSFLYNSVRNGSINYLRHKIVEDKYAASVIQEESSEEYDDLRVMEDELYRLLFKTVDELPARCKEIFQLHMDGKSNDEIASLLNLSVMTVKTQKKRAMHYIRERLGGRYFVMLAFQMF